MTEPHVPDDHSDQTEPVPVASGGVAQDPVPALPAPRPESTASHKPPLPQMITELREMIVTYIKQQTLVPLADLKRYVGWGIGGAILLGFAVVFFAMAGLRALQTETGDTFTGTWDAAPYLIVFVALAAGGTLAAVVASGRSRK